MRVVPSELQVDGGLRERASLALCAKVCEAIASGHGTEREIRDLTLCSRNSVYRALGYLEARDVIIGEALKWGGPTYYRPGPNWTDFDILLRTAVKLDLLPSRV